MNPIEILAHPYTVVLTRWLLATVLLVAGVSKLFDREGFGQAVESYQILPTHAAQALALILPYLEIAVGFALAVGVWTRGAAVLTLSLFASFMIAIAINIARGRDLNCHCFGKLHQDRISSTVLLRNSFFALLAAQILIFTDGFLALDGWLSGANTAGAPPIDGMIPLTLAGLAAIVAYLIVQQVWKLFRLKQF